MNEELNFIIDSTRELMQNALTHLEKEFRNIRAGKASPASIKNIARLAPMPCDHAATSLPRVAGSCLHSLLLFEFKILISTTSSFSRKNSGTENISAFCLLNSPLPGLRESLPQTGTRTSFPVEENILVTCPPAIPASLVGSTLRTGKSFQRHENFKYGALACPSTAQLLVFLIRFYVVLNESYS